LKNTKHNPVRSGARVAAASMRHKQKFFGSFFQKRTTSFGTQPAQGAL
jgi:hypothetical protein